MPESNHISGINSTRFNKKPDEVVVQLERRIPDNLLSSLERNLINEIKDGKIENARIIDKSDNLVKGIEFIGNKYSVRLSPECIFKDKFTDATYIHNHPLNAPL